MPRCTLTSEHPCERLRRSHPRPECCDAENWNRFLQGLKRHDALIRPMAWRPWRRRRLLRCRPARTCWRRLRMNLEHLITIRSRNLNPTCARAGPWRARPTGDAGGCCRQSQPAEVDRFVHPFPPEGCCPAEWQAGCPISTDPVGDGRHTTPRTDRSRGPPGTPVRCWP